MFAQSPNFAPPYIFNEREATLRLETGQGSLEDNLDLEAALPVAHSVAGA